MATPDTEWLASWLHRIVGGSTTHITAPGQLAIRETKAYLLPLLLLLRLLHLLLHVCIVLLLNILVVHGLLHLLLLLDLTTVGYLTSTAKQDLLWRVHGSRVGIVVALRRWWVVVHLLLLEELLVLELLHALRLSVHHHVVLACVLLLPSRDRVLVGVEQSGLEDRVGLILRMSGRHLIRLGLQIDHLMRWSATVDLLVARVLQG